MLKIPFLRNILLISLLFSAVFPLYELLFTIPNYQHLLMREAEREAAKFVHFLVTSYHLEDFDLGAGRVPNRLVREISHLKDTEDIYKLRVFSPQGEIVYSTEAKEIGTFNRKGYFYEIVAKGHFYSKAVAREAITAEGVTSDRDMVETYVPIMVADQFKGALEVYTDITRPQKQFSGQARKSFLTLLAASGSLLLVALVLLWGARKNIQARVEAEQALQKSNEELEGRVVQRTLELSQTNQQLSTEVVERKKAQFAQREAFVAISEARDRINAIVFSVADALLVMDSHDLVVLINPAAESLFEVRGKEILGRPLGEFARCDELLAAIGEARSGLRQQELVEFDFAMNRSGENRVYQGRTSLLRETAVDGKGLILLIHDVTLERQIERMKSEFVSMAAHELQTPLTMILGYSELLLDPEKEFSAGEVTDFLRIINEKAVELSTLTDDILDLSRIEDGRGMNLHFSQANISAICRRLIEEFRGANPMHSFSIDIAPEDLIVSVDESRLTQVIENLLGNAVKYSPEGGEIRLVLGREENWLCIEIHDCGIGMSEEQLHNAFERFYRGDASNTAVRGTGLGLSIAKMIVDAHGGRIDIRSQLGEGTLVEIRLPLVGSN